MSARRLGWQELVVGAAGLYAVACGVVLSRAGVMHADELLHYVVVNKDTLRETIADSWSHTHPPLYFVVLRWLLAATPELQTWRLAGVAATAVAGVYLFAWLARISDRTCALVGTLLFLTAPSTIWLSAHVRGYALFLMFTCAWLHYLERAVAEGTRRPALAAAVAWGLAAATHYGMALPTAGGAVAVLVAWRRGALTGRAARFLIGAHALPMLAIAAYAAFHLTHVTTLQALKAHYLPELFTRAGESPVHYALRAVRLLFSAFADPKLSTWVAAPQPMGDALLAITGACAVLVAWRRRAAVLPYLAPLAAGTLLGALRVYPFGGSRHAIGVLPAMLALVACGVACLGPKARRIALCAAGLFGAVWAATLCPLRPEAFAQIDRAAEQTFAEHVRQVLPPGAVVYMALEDELFFRYLVLDPRRDFRVDVSARPVPARAALGPYHLITRGWRRSPRLCEELATVQRSLPDPGVPFWVVTLSAGVRPEDRGGALEHFGDGWRSILRYETGPALDAHLAAVCPPR